ncbi:hypothetical protein BBP40_009506 [Aspergillus hancockii]|nr:hypothetical protein BBP40_009506 [Aspergillus hancockii]
MIDELDKGLSSVISYLESTDELDNTFVLFMSDNGAKEALLEALPTMGNKESFGAILDHFYNNSVENIGNPDPWAWYGLRWACAAMAPSRGFKTWITKGEVRCPCIIRCPEFREDEYAHANSFTTIMDILPTIGASWVSHLQANLQSTVVHDENEYITGWGLLWLRAIRRGPWRALSMPAPRGKEQWELYNVAEDPGEVHNRAEEKPEVLDRLVKHWKTSYTETVLRFYSRALIVKKIGLHDYCSLLAWIIDFGLSFSLIYATTMGLGLPGAEIDSGKRSSITRVTFAFTVLYNPALMSVKTSILLFYLTFAKGQGLFRLANYATLAIVNVAGLALTLLMVFQCRPVGAVFQSPLPSKASCTSIITLYLASAPINIITDIAILFLPMPILTKIHLPWRQKIILTATFGGGVFVTIIDVIRIVYLQRAATQSNQALQSTRINSGALINISSYAALSFMWSVVEVNMSMICSCIPLLKPLIARVIPKMIGHTSRNRRSTTDTTDDSTTTGAFTSSPRLSLPIDKQASPSRNIRRNTRPSNAHKDDQYARHIENRADESQIHQEPSRSMVTLNDRESLAPVALITVVFWLWGFSYGLLGNLSTQLQRILQLDAWESLGMHATYFSGYLVSPLLLGRWLLTRWGYKPTFITGLCVYACGTLIFWPSAVLTSYPAFLVSNLIIGAGLGVLETAADSFITLCGPPKNGEIRLNVAQGVQGIATVVSALLAQKVLYRGVHSASSLVNPQWTYLSIAFFDVLLAGALYYSPIPEAPDADLQELADRHREDNSRKVLGVPVIWTTLSLGASSLYLYTAAQEVLTTSFETLVAAATPEARATTFDYLIIAQSVFAVGRFLTALTLFFLEPRWVLLIGYIGMIVSSILCMNTNGWTALIMALIFYLFESGVFGTVFAISLRGMGRHTKTAASILATAISGGAFFPFAQYAVSVSHGVLYSYCVLIALSSAGAIFPLYLNLVPAAKRQVDRMPDRHASGTSGDG